jgi:hypothetical protein
VFKELADRLSRTLVERGQAQQEGATQYGEASQDVNKAINVPTETLYNESSTTVLRHMRVAQPWV